MEPVQLLRHNLALKIVSLVFALLLFYHVRGQEFAAPRKFTTWLDIPVPPGHALVAPPSSHRLVTIDVRAPSWMVEDVRDTDWRAELDLADYQPGEARPVRVHVIGPQKLRDRDTSVDWQPREMVIHLEPRITKSFPVTLDVSAALPPEWNWTRSPQVTPGEVLVQGLRPYVQRIARVVAALRNISPQEAVSLTVTLQALDRSGQDLTGELQLEPSFVRVTGRLTRRNWPKRVYVQVVFAGVPPESRPSVTAEPSVVTVFGSLEALRDLQFLETPVVELPPGQTRVSEEVTLAPPPGTTRVQPSTVKVTVRAIPRTPAAGAGPPPPRP